MNEAHINYTKEAFLHPWNLVFLIVAMAAAFGAGFVFPDFMFNIIMVITAGLELIFLGTMPKQERFRRAVKARQAAVHAKPPTQKELYRLLRRPNQRRYARLRDLEKKIESNYRKLSYASQGLLESHISKIDGLLDSYLTLLNQKERYVQYASAPRKKR